jgi:hypothetical protein
MSSLTFGIFSIRDLFAKLQRDAAHLDQEVTSDGFYNFVVTGYSMIDWVKNDPIVPHGAKAPAVVKSLYDDKSLRVCGDLATACKHFAFTTRQPITELAESTSGYNRGRYGKGPCGVGEKSVQIKLSDDTTFDCLDLVKKPLPHGRISLRLMGSDAVQLGSRFARELGSSTRPNHVRAAASSPNNFSTRY